MDVDQLRLPGEIFRQIDNSLAEKRVALGIVCEVNTLVLIDAVAVEIQTLRDEVKRAAVFGFALIDRAFHAFPVQRDLQLPIHLLQIGPFFLNARVERSHDPHLVTLFGKGLAQSGDHIGQSSGLGVGVQLAGGQKDFHGGLSFR